ncbi:S8 family serine peptidase [Cellulomonas soli]
MSTTADDPRLRAAVVAATQAGALVVASAGNRTTTEDTSDSPRYPAAYPEVLAVTAVDTTGAPSDDAIHGAHVDIAAPGTNVLTTFHGAGDCLLDGTGVSTSFATAYVSAAAALVAQRFPQETPEQWRFRLVSSAARTDPDSRDDLMGWGIVRPDQALALVDDGSLPGPASPAHARPVVDVAVAPPVDGSVDSSPLLGVRRDAAAWGAAAVVAVLLALLGARLVGRPRARRRAVAGPR